MTHVCARVNVKKGHTETLEYDKQPTPAGAAPLAVAFDSASELARLVASVDEALDRLVSPLRDSATSHAVARRFSWEVRAGAVMR